MTTVSSNICKHLNRFDTTSLFPCHQEQDSQFRYIALELCDATVQDYVEKDKYDRSRLNPVTLLHEAMKGITHLHSLDIGKYVHVTQSQVHMCEPVMVNSVGLNHLSPHSSVLHIALCRFPGSVAGDTGLT